MGALVTYWANRQLKIRELEHQDRRQWDTSILETYIEAAALAHGFHAFRHLSAGEQVRARYEELADAYQRLHDIQRKLTLIGSTRLSEATQQLLDACESVYGQAHDGIKSNSVQNRAIFEGERAFQDAVRRELRVNPEGRATRTGQFG